MAWLHGSVPEALIQVGAAQLTAQALDRRREFHQWNARAVEIFDAEERLLALETSHAVPAHDHVAFDAGHLALAARADDRVVGTRGARRAQEDQDFLAYGVFRPAPGAGPILEAPNPHDA